MPLTHQPSTLAEAFPAYPDFHGDKEAECIWLQSQVVRLRGQVHFLEERARLTASFNDMASNLKRLLDDRNKELQAENAAMQIEIGRLAQYDPTGKYLKAAEEMLSRPVDWVLSIAANRLIFLDDKSAPTQS